MKRYSLIFLFIFLTTHSWAQKERKFIREGNRFYEAATADTSAVDTTSYIYAETAYRKALDVKPNDFNALFNIGDALFKQNKFEEAESQFHEILDIAPTKEDKSKVYFNIGDALLMQQKLDESIDAFKDALRNNPNDIEAKYNLEFARKMKEMKEQQQQQQDQKDQDQPEPSEYAKQLLEQAKKLVAEQKYMQAYSLLKEGEEKDPTVKAFAEFTKRIFSVIEVNSYKQ